MKRLGRRLCFKTELKKYILVNLKPNKEERENESM